MTEGRRGRPRNEASGPEILAATIDLVAEVGLAGLTVDAVAKRAGVGRSTVYRRWTSKEALLLDAWTSMVTPTDIPDSGSLREDLDQWFTATSHHKTLPEETVRKVFPQMLAAAAIDPEVGAAYRAFIAERRRPIQIMLERALARGELAAHLPLSVVQDLFISPAMYRFLVTGEVVDDSTRRTIVEIVLAGIEALTATQV